MRIPNFQTINNVLGSLSRRVLDSFYSHLLTDLSSPLYISVHSRIMIFAAPLAELIEGNPTTQTETHVHKHAEWQTNYSTLSNEENDWETAKNRTHHLLSDRYKTKKKKPTQCMLLGLAITLGLYV